MKDVYFNKIYNRHGNEYTTQKDYGIAKTSERHNRFDTVSL